MSGDVQPRKRKDKRRKKDVSNLPAEYRAQKMRVVLEDLSGSEDVGSSTFSSDETIHVHKDTGTGGNICAKVVFFLLLGALAVMVGLILTEYRGSSDMDTPVAESRWAQVFDGWVDESPSKHDEHDKQLGQSGGHNDEHSEETEEHGDDEHEEEEVESEEAQFPEEEEEQVPEESEEGLEEEDDGEEEEEEEEAAEEEEEDEEEEEEDEQEVSEEELEGIPGVTESDEEEDEGDGENAEDDDEEEEEEEEEAAAAGEEDEVGGEDGDDEEAVEETKEEEVEGGEAEGDHESAHEEDGGDDDDEDEPSGVALKFGVGVALVLVAHVVLVRKWNADDGVTVQPTVPGQAIGTDHGVEEITPDLIERRQTLIPQDNAQDDLEGSEYSEDEDAEDEEEKLQKVEMLEDYMTKYRQQAPTKKEYTREEKRVSPAESEEDAGEEEEGEKDTKEDSEEPEEEESEEEEEQPRAFVTRAADITPEESGTEEDESEEAEFVPVRRVTKSSGGQGYEKTDITSEDDLKIREDLDLADAEMEEDFDLNGQKPEEALRTFTTILMKNPASPRAHHGKARALDKLAEKKHSNALLQEAIDAYERVLALGSSVPDKLFVQAAERCINRMRFKGQYHTAVHIHKKLIQRFSDDPAYPNQLAVTYLMINRLADAKHILEDTLRRWPDNGFAQVHYGFILKTSDNNNEAAVDYLTQGIATREPGTLDGRFFFHLGDALTRLGRHEEAGKIYDLGVREGLFLSKYQRSLYNVNRLRAQPWWTPEETTYSKYFKKLQDNWQQIREEGLIVLANKIFKDEAENLKDIGNWQQFELFARGRRITSNCLKAPFTCQLISEFPAARDCRRGQAKFSVMHAGTHVWPHCGPTNCRLRSHLGLIVPEGTYIRVAEETRTWKEGKLFVFDDSFEHEVWHNGTTTRLVLIVDVWHPELTEDEKRSMPAI